MEYSSINSAYTHIPVHLVLALKAKHAEPQRFYHTQTHVRHLMMHAINYSDLIHDKMAVLLAILAHDAVYEVDDRYPYNEEKSVEYLESLLKRFAGVCDSFYKDNFHSIEFAKVLILMTKTHLISDDLSDTQKSDASLFLDFDLSILSADRAKYMVFEENIRKEFSHVPDDVFAEKRKEVLTHLLDTNIYKSSAFLPEIAKAKSNLTYAIGLL